MLAPFAIISLRDLIILEYGRLTVKDRNTSGNLSTGVEQRKHVDGTGVERSFGKTEQESDDESTREVVNGSSGSRDNGPCPEN